MPQPCRTCTQINFSHNIWYVKLLLAQHVTITAVQEKLAGFRWKAIQIDPPRIGFISKHNELAVCARTDQSHYIWKMRLDRQLHLVI